MNPRISWFVASKFKLLALGLVALPLKIHGDALDTLQLRNPFPTPDVLRAIGFGNGKFIAADDGIASVLLSGCYTLSPELTFRRKEGNCAPPRFGVAQVFVCRK